MFEFGLSTHGTIILKKGKSKSKWNYYESEKKGVDEDPHIKSMTKMNERHY